MPKTKNERTVTTETVAYKSNGLRILEAAPITWNDKISALSQVDRQEYARFLEGVCERAARLIGYIEARGALGCGDSGHLEGVKRSNRKGARVRKALGFTYHKQDITF